jgi:hypothetical protein
MWFPEKLEKKLQLFDKNPELGFSFINYCLIDENDKHTLNQFLAVAVPSQLSDNIIYNSLRENVVNRSTSVVGKYCFDKVGNFAEPFSKKIYFLVTFGPKF